MSQVSYIHSCVACKEPLDIVDGYIEHECSVKCTRCGHSACPICGNWCDNLDCICYTDFDCECIYERRDDGKSI
jgi:hypothetical protein